jgi:ATP-dependent RNA helicase DeaD
MKNFTDIALPETIQRALEKLNFVDTTQIQEKAIPVLMEGKDLIACSETGSGKTAAYVIPMLVKLFEDEKSSALILAPTRELAQQINEFIDSLLIYEKDFQVVRLVGGSDIRKQFKKLQRKSRIVVATPGRLIDHLKRNTIQLNKTEILVLDEGDRMIDMGFAPQLQQILNHLPKERQTSFFTATIDEKVKSLANQYLKNPVKLTIGTASRPVSSIKQNVMQVDLNQKDEALVNELNTRVGSVIVFLKTKYRTDRMYQYLLDYGFSVEQIHGGRTQGQRNKAIRSFKEGKVRVLCATDVAARGIDVPHVEHVINVDLPMMDEDYVHRIGRTARNGAEGEALSFVMPQETRYWNMIARKYNIIDVMLPEKASSRGKDSRGGFGRRDSKRGGGSFSSNRRSNSGPARFSKCNDGDESSRSFSKKRDDERPSSFSRKRDDERPSSFSRKRDDRPGSFPKRRDDDRRGSFSKKRDDERPSSFSRKRDDERPSSFSRKRDDERPSSFSRKRDDRPGSFPKKRDDDRRGSFSKGRDDDRPRSFSKKRDDERPSAAPKKWDGESRGSFSKSREETSEGRTPFKKRSSSSEGGAKKVSFKKKSGNTFKKAGGFKKSRSKANSSRASI